MNLIELLVSWWTWLFEHPLVLIAAIVGWFLFRYVQGRADAYAGGGWAGVVIWFVSKLFFVAEYAWVLLAIWFVFTAPLVVYRQINNQALAADAKLSSLPGFGNPMPPVLPGGGDGSGSGSGGGQQTPVPGGQSVTGRFYLRQDAHMREGPNGDSALVGIVPMSGAIVEIKSTGDWHPGDGYCEAGECRRVKVTVVQSTDPSFIGKSGYIHAVTLGGAAP